MLASFWHYRYFDINNASAQVVHALSNFQCTVFLPDCWLVFRYRQQPTTIQLVRGFCGSTLSSSKYWACYKIPSCCCTFQKSSIQFEGIVTLNFTPEQTTKPERGSRSYLYSFFNPCARWGGWLASRPGCLNPRECPGTYCIGGWVSTRSGLDRCGKSRPHRNSIPGPPSS